VSDVGSAVSGGASVSETEAGDELPVWLGAAGRTGWDDDSLRPHGGSDEADEMVSGDVDEEPSRDTPVDDEHAGRWR